MADCPRAGEWHGCKFEPRYDIGPPAGHFKTESADNLPAVIAACKPKTYVRDVCVRCGRTIERVK